MSKYSYFTVGYSHNTKRFFIDEDVNDAYFKDGCIWDDETETWSMNDDVKEIDENAMLNLKDAIYVENEIIKYREDGKQPSFWHKLTS